MNGGGETHHFRRLIAIWVVLAVVVDVVFYFAIGPHVPPGTLTSSASGAQFDFNVLFLIAFPVILAVWVYWAYALIVWRGSRAGAAEPEGGAKAPRPSRHPDRLDRHHHRHRDRRLHFRHGRARRARRGGRG